MEKKTTHAEMVRRAYERVFNDRDFSAIDEFWQEPYIQHNPLAPDGKAGLRALLATPGLLSQEKTVSIKRVAEDGDLVWLHSEIVVFGKHYAALDIFRVDETTHKIIEHWDVLQEIPAESANTNTMF